MSRIVQEIEVGGKRLKALFDTGSARSYIRSEFQPPTTGKVPPIRIGLGGRVVRTDQRCVATAKIDGLEFDFSAYLIDEIGETEYGRIDAIIGAINEREGYGRRSTIICVAEGAKPAGGEQIVERVVEDSAEPIRLGGVARWLCAELEGRVRAECRAIVLGHIQRGGTPTPADRVLCTRFGVAAVHAAVGGESGKIVTIRNDEIGLVSISKIAGRQRLVDPDSEIVRVVRSTAVSFGDGFRASKERAPAVPVGAARLSPP